MCESVAGYIESLTGGEVIAKIISNYAGKSLARAKMKIKKQTMPKRINLLFSPFKFFRIIKEIIIKNINSNTSGSRIVFAGSIKRSMCRLIGITNNPK